MSVQQKSMSGVETSWSASDGTAVRRVDWAGNAGTGPFVVGLHGLNCTSWDFGPLAESLNASGINFAAWNLRGQGTDPVAARRGAWLDVDGMTADLAKFLDDQPDGRNCFIAGDSMGALLAIRALESDAVRSRIAGLMLFVPVVQLAQRNPPWLKSAMRGLSRMLPALRLNPSWFVHGKSTVPKLTRIPERQAAFVAAPHRMHTLTPGFLADMGELIESADTSAAAVRLPVAMFSAGHDAFVRPEDSERFFARIGSTDKTHFHYPASYHQLLHDLDADRVCADAIDWVRNRSPQR